MHARYYSYNLGRFTSIDPVGGEGGLSQSWNRYAYVRGNPVNANDPDGRELLGALIGVAGGAIKAAYENIRLATQRPVTMRELVQNVMANVAGGAITGATAGLGSGVLGSAPMGAVGSAAGGVVKRTTDPCAMNTAAFGRDAMRRDAIAGGAGAALGALVKGGALALERPKIEAVTLRAAAARAGAEEDRTLTAVAHETGRQASRLIRDVTDRAAVIGTVAGSGTAEATAARLPKVKRGDHTSQSGREP
jgi:uncharacterized protein RhaS with RHS repeats